MNSLMGRAWLALWHAPGRMALAMLKAASASFWAQCGAAMAMTGVFIGFGLVVWLGPWAPAREEQQLTLLGQGMLISGFLVLVALVCIMGQRMALSLGKDGFNANVERDDDPPPAAAPQTVARVTAEATVETAPQG